LTEESQYIDLTYDIEEGMLTFDAPWHPIVSITQLGRLGLEGRESRRITFGTHTGTHIDAPRHFIQNGASIDDIALDKLIGPVTIVDYSHMKENEAVTGAMLAKQRTSSRMIFKFGWGKYWKTKRYCSGYPFFSEEAADYLVSNRVRLIGLDTPSPDDSTLKLSGDERDSPVHKIFLRNGIVLVEYIANLEKVTEYEGWHMIAIPLRIRGADGSPARVCLFK
jgi:arylformamidase